ncbi:NAD(P)H-hydrate dehydratase [Mycetocola miduiensis]|uniref:ADP-dependent (S)-NAD(P)H-hydrate dehydratase n=1 Tax=Mycetocola miduiensis TaxID=995034 RepID=A0A1I5CAR9_9MICO|nr:NAD(P)H-hydrate dehydratase [Mycetocola miduiensis]SFN83741.1 yjeF C-terminal region, hydroxyethylthiazole kinase-related [Mycetocola miduiensis]
MSSPAEPQTVTPNLLREWPLPEAGDSKYGRGQVIVVGGALRSPGAAMLSGLAALRVGAGRLTLAVAASVATAVAVAVPECGIVPLDETADGSVSGDSVDAAERDLSGADAVLVGPGLDDPDELERMLSALPPLVGSDSVVVLDAFALGVLPKVPDAVEAFGNRLVLTPNKEEAARLLERDLDDLVDDIAEIARRYRAVVTCYDVIASPDGRIWRTGTGGGGLATSGSGDVLAGAITGLCARGATAEQAAVWATHAHAAAGDRLAVHVGPLGFLASELLDELPRVLVEIGA